MPAPSDLTITTKAVQRLVKEETYYRAELVKQEERVRKLQAEVDAGGPDLVSNAEFVLRQESKAAEETRGVFGPLAERTAEAVRRLEEQIAMDESGPNTDLKELSTAREALALGKKTLGPEAEGQGL